MDANRLKQAQRRRRKIRVRKRVFGTSERPRLTVFRSHKNIYAQVVDDMTGRTLVAASTRDKAVRDKVAYGGNKAAAVVVGAQLAELAKGKGILTVTFDRNGYRYHGRVKELADSARKGGLVF
ncbi:MAG: 50S ribosomal protein L18 [Phycisphaerae bacterium]|nr:50S ribosomal protein L18 [Phycisphaerae bacterium]